IRCVRRQQSTIGPDVEAPAALRHVCSGRNDPGGEQTWRPEHYEISASSKLDLREVVIRRVSAGSRPILLLGKADDTVEETGASTRYTAGERDPASKDRLSEITSGSCREQQGLDTTCKDSRNEVKCRRKRELNGSGT